MKFNMDVMPLKADLNTMLYNSAASTIPKWWTFKLLWWMQNLNHSTWDHDMLHTEKP
jgi:hypothetical protein